MSKLDKDILFLLFKELQDDSKSLFSCLMVNRLWCEVVIPILWRNPWSYADTINYCNKSYLYYIITFYLPDDIKKFLNRQGIQLPPISRQSLLFDYLSLCRSINMNVINSIINVGSPSAYNQFLLQQEIYSLFLRKCPEFKYLDIKSIQHQIFYFPKAKTCLNSICELECNKSTDSSYFYGLACLCQNIQRLIIINTDTESNHGITKLIEVQKNLKYFEWQDDFEDDYFIGDPYKEIFLALIKKADTLNHFIMEFKDIDIFYNYSFMHMLLPKLYKLKTLKFYPPFLNGYNFELQSKLLVYRDLEVFQMNDIGFNTITCLIENSGGHLKEISTNYGAYGDDFNEDSLILILTIYKKCPLIEHLSLEFPSTKAHFNRFEELLKNCQKLKVLILNILNNRFKDVKSQFVDGEELLKILIRSAQSNLKEIRLYNYIKFSLESLEEFLENWKGRHAISIITYDPIHRESKYVNLINKYKSDGVIKDFKVWEDL